MIFNLRDYQTLAVDDAVDFFATAKHGDRRLYASPTGSGKSVIELALLERLNANRVNAALLTPRVEIVVGMLEKLGHADASEWSRSRVNVEAESRAIFTPIRFRNLLAAGEIEQPRKLIIDEAHHESAETYQIVQALLGQVPAVGFTASPFRGTPKQTGEFLAAWGDGYTVVMTYRVAVERGVIAWPSFKVVPLVDDDMITVTAGEIQAKAAGEMVMSRADALIEFASRYCESGRWDRSTMFSVPSTDCAHDLTLRLRSAGFPAVIVVQDTTAAERQVAFRSTLECRAALVQINVVSEGVDLPIRRLIDASPTLSPVKWLQQIGRIMRPLTDGESAPEYVCTNRNLSRHAYLAEGLVPASSVAECQTAFGGASDRDGNRVIGLEGVGKFKSIELPLSGGLKGVMYNLESFDRQGDAGDGGSVVKTEYAVMCHPCSAEPILAAKTSSGNPDGTWTRGKWRRLAVLPDLTGFASVGNDGMSDKQKKWWERDAGKFGLDPTAEPSRKNFQALPVLADLRLKLKGE